MDFQRKIIVAEMLLLAAIVAFLGTSNYLFHKRRHQFPINKRTPVLASYALVYSSAGMALADIITNTSDSHVQCVIPSLFVSTAAHLFLLSFGFKVVDLSIAYEQELIKRKIAKHDGSSSQIFKIPFTVKVHKYLTTGKSPRVLLGGIAAFILLSILAGAALGPSAFDADAEWMSDKCATFTLVLSIAVFTNLGLVAICSLAVAKSLRKVQDNFSKKFEIKAILSFLLVDFVWFIIGNFVPVIVQGQIATIFWNQLHPFFAGYVCFLDAWIQARQVENKKKDDSSKSTRDSHSPRSVGASEAAGGGKPPTSVSSHSHGEDATGSERPSSPSAVAPKGKATGLSRSMQEIETILDHPESFADLEEFMSKEFCVEELYFLRDVRKFRTEFSRLTTSQAAEKSRRLYTRYVDLNSPLAVNIAGKDREKLKQMFGLSDSSSHSSEDDLANCFQDAYTEVLRLLATDSYRRFKGQYKSSIRRAKAELQESIPVLPTPVSINV